MSGSADRGRAALALGAGALLAACGATPAPGELPVAVTGFVERAEACHHWGGEEPYDAERARQIGAAAARLRCETLERDAVALKARWPARADVARAVDAVMALE